MEALSGLHNLLLHALHQGTGETHVLPTGLVDSPSLSRFRRRGSFLAQRAAVGSLLYVPVRQWSAVTGTVTMCLLCLLMHK